MVHHRQWVSQARLLISNLGGGAAHWQPNGLEQLGRKFSGRN